MSHLPIIAHFRADISSAKRERAGRLAEQLLRARPQLGLDERFRPMAPQRLDDGAALHLDDLSDIPYLNRFYDITFMQDRARLRAGDGDFVASCATPVTGYEAYCGQRLGLGAPTWLYPKRRENPLQLASACWHDRSVRRSLIGALRSSELRYLHPHMGNLAAWELAALLRQASRRPLQVIAPPPGVTKFANNKLDFAHTIERLFGERLLPPTEGAFNYSSLALLVRDLAESAQTIVLKIPESAGGAGNVVIKADRVRGKSLADIHELLKSLLQVFSLHKEFKLLVGAWEMDVFCAPSVQIWIPPQMQGPPQVEGVYEQLIHGKEGFFVGNKPAQFPPVVVQEIVDRSALLALLYQRLGYVGRCSFDLVLLGKDLGACRIEFIECNGRWGGTSTPMTLVNRLLGDFAKHPYAVRECRADGLDRLSFADLQEHFSDDLFDVRTKRGRLVLFNVGRILTHSGITVLALGESWDDAQRTVTSVFPERLRELVASTPRS